MRTLRFSPSWLVAALVIHIAPSLHAQATKPGVTVWLYHLGEELREMPILVDGQTPNVAGDFPNIDFTGSWASEYEEENPLASHYLGHALGTLIVAESGTYQFRLTSDDGSKFFIGSDGALIIDNDTPGLGNASASLSLLAGSYPFYVDFYQNGGDARVLLEWKPPGAASFAIVPQSALETEDGQIHVTSPGVKTFYYQDGEGGIAGGPGDARPLTGVHPSFDLENFRPSGFAPAVGGMDFLPDGRLAICTWDSDCAVYLLDNLQGPGPATVHRFAEGLGEPLGLRVVDGVIYVAQKQEVTRLVDLDGDGIADEYTAVAHGWPASFNYHEFTFNLVWKDGHFWTTTSVPLRTGSTAYLPGSEPSYPVPHGPGSLIKIDPLARSWEAVASGLRTPNGMGLGVDGELFHSDNQGDWLPSSRLNHLREGEFYGHQENPTDTRPYKEPALWLPHGEISNSPAEPTLIPGGPYAGQMLFTELTHGGVKRVFMEKINGEYQGAVFRFTQGLETGMNRLAWGPEGSLYVGGLGSGGNWNWQGTRAGLQRLKPTGRTTFEMKSIRARADGFIIEFTQPVPYHTLADPENYLIQQYHYTPTTSYGGSKQNVTAMTFSDALISTDRRKVFVGIPSLQNGRVTYFRLRNFVNDQNVAPWTTEAWYTLNDRPAAAGADFPVMEEPPEPVAAVPPVKSFIHEAEEAEFFGSPNIGIRNEHQGFTGTGYVDYAAASGETTRWTVTANHAGPHQVRFRYALGTGSRPLRIDVNGSEVMPSLDFPETGGWATWGYTAPVTVHLGKGINTISAVSIGSSGGNVDHLEISGPPPPPPGALVLFDGTENSLATHWKRNSDGTPAHWPVSEGAVAAAGSGDISTIQGFKDFDLHVEWLSPPGGTGQLAGNSGVKLQRFYEIQILNSPPGATLSATDVGSIYLLRPPDENASLGAGNWQSYDVRFTAARWSEGVKLSDARATVRWNGILIHDDVIIPASTGASPQEAPGLHSVLLQAHSTAASGPVLFRNIWIAPADSFQQQWDAWIGGFGLEGDDLHPLADPDGDGLRNRWEYALGGNPAVADAHGHAGGRIPQMSVVTTGDENFVQFSFLRRSDWASRGLRFTIETSATLAPDSWTRHTGTEIEPPDPTGDGLTERCVIRADVPIPTETKQLFARLRAEILD